jgi:hypothetical protein
VIRELEIQQPLEAPRCVIVVGIQPEQAWVRARLGRDRRARRQQLLEGLAESSQSELGLQQVHAVDVEHRAVEQRRRTTVDGCRHAPPLQQRQRELRDVLEAIVEGDDGDRFRQIRGRIHQLAHRRAHEVLGEHPQLRVEFLGRDRLGAGQPGTGRMAIVVADDQRVALGDARGQRVELEVDAGSHGVQLRPATAIDFHRAP